MKTHSLQTFTTRNRNSSVSVSATLATDYLEIKTVFKNYTTKVVKRSDSRSHWLFFSVSFFNPFFLMSKCMLKVKRVTMSSGKRSINHI